MGGGLPAVYEAGMALLTREAAEETGIYEPASEKKKKAEEASGAAEDAQALLDKESSEALRKKRNSLFQTDSGSSGVVTEGVGARDTYFGN